MVRPEQQLKQNLSEVIYFLHSGCSAWDTGMTVESLQLSIQLRKLFHETNSSRALVNQLGLQDMLMYDTSTPFDPLPNTAGRFALTVTSLGDWRAFPRLDDPVVPPHAESVSDWWREAVVQDADGFTFTRETLALAMANQDGAHIDPELHEAYDRLRSPEGVLSFDVSITGIAEASVRQMAHETLVSLAHDRRAPFPSTVPRRRYRYVPGPRVMDVYKLELQPVADALAGEFGVDGRPRVDGPTAGWPRHIGRHDACPCGSGKKFKDCHGYG